MLYLIKLNWIFTKFRIGQYNMISFQTDNLDYRIYKVDNFDLSSHLTNEKLDHIFKEYLYFTLSEKIGNDGWIAFNYELRTDKFDDLFTDNVLGSVLIFWLSYHYILNILNMSEIKLISNVNHPNFINLYFNQRISDASYGILANYNKGTEFYTEHMFGLRNLKYSTYDIQDRDRQWFLTNSKIELTKEMNNHITIVSENFITDLDKQQAMDNIFGAYTDNNNVVTILPENVKNAVRFAFALEMYGEKYMIIFSTNYNNYIISNRLLAAFELMDTRINNVIWKHKRISYLYAEEKNFITGYGDPIFKEGNIMVTNEYLDTYIKDKYNTGSSVFTQQPTFDDVVVEILDDIKTYVDEIGKGIAYFDFDSAMLHATIGNQDDYSFLDIYGYDEARQRPIILGINKDYESGGSWFRSIKIISGGITAINNAELMNNIVADEYEYLLQTTLVDVEHIHYMDVITMMASVYGFTPTYPKAFQLFNPVESDRKFFYNDGEYNAKAETIDAQVYKQSKVYDQTGVDSLPIYTMRTFMYEALTSWGNQNTQMRLGNIEFYLRGERVEIPYDNMSSHGFGDMRRVISDLPTTTGTSNTSRTLNSFANKRGVIHFNKPIRFDQILIMPHHQYNNYTTSSFKDCRFGISILNVKSYEFEEATHLFDMIFDGEIRMWDYYQQEMINLPLTPIASDVVDSTTVPMYTLLDVASFGLDATDTNSCAIPWDAMLSLFNNVTDLPTMLTFLTEYFQIESDNNDITFDDIEYNNLFIKYVPIVSGDGMFHISHRNSVVGYRTMNDRLLQALSLDIKQDLLEGIYNTNEVKSLVCLKGSEIVNQINDDSEFNVNSNWSREIFTNGVDVKELHTLPTAVRSEFLTMLMHENMYHSKVTLSSGRYICALFKLEDVIKNSHNNSIIFNKVIGSDWYSYYSLKATGNDITFSGYFINSYTDNHYAQWLLDLDNGKIKNIASTPFEFNCGTTNPIITNLECIENREMYVIDKDDYDTIYSNWLNVFKIYDILPVYQIEYARKPFDITKNQIFNVYANEYTLVSEV